MRDEIIYLEDIVAELSKELGIPEKELDELCRYSLKYTHKLMADPNVISIVFYNLGVLHFNVRSASSIYKKTNLYNRYVEIIDSKIDIINKIYSKNKHVVHKRSSYLSKFKKYFFKNRKARQEAKRVEVLKKIEQKQNKI